MKSSHMVLLIGTGIVLSGLAIGVYSVITFDAIAKDSLITYHKSPKPQPLQPGKNITSPIPARVGDSYIIEVTHDPTQVPINVSIRDPNGNIAKQLAGGRTTTQFTATIQGTQRLIIINEGMELTNVSLSVSTIGLSGFPFIYLVMLAGIIIIVGIIVLIVGGVKYIKERKAYSRANRPADL